MLPSVRGAGNRKSAFVSPPGERTATALPVRVAEGCTKQPALIANPLVLGLDPREERVGVRSQMEWVGKADVHTTDFAEGKACLTWTLYTFEVKGTTLVQTISDAERAPEGETAARRRSRSGSSVCRSSGADVYFQLIIGTGAGSANRPGSVGDPLNADHRAGSRSR